MNGMSTHELDHRSNDGLEVTLLWEAETNRVTVIVFDAKSRDGFEIDVDPTRALDAFHHPYAYAASRAVHYVGGTRTLIPA